MTTIIDNNYDTLTVLDNNKQLLIRSINDYTLLKYEDFNGERIHLKIGNVEVLETFNDGIFNIRVGDHRLQSHNKIEVSKRIKYCMTNQVTDPIMELMREELSQEINREFFNNMLKPFKKRTEILDDKSIIIDGIFKVDMNGQAHVKIGRTKWKFVCIVAGDMNFKHQITHALGKFKIDFKTTEIYLKVLFLLYPDLKDRVFFNQLPSNIKKKLQENEKDKT